MDVSISSRGYKMGCQIEFFLFVVQNILFVISDSR